ncbi:MAG: DUF2079 domain-containing protein [Gomphosphaeria aponina SAG 52.96 = DSM 107014]|uniref:DUF2079 domain-containing protein n=1 Tax=Gomphosphaeria aponina SAG 52.96 = DSM 107014 TaxID=1521640 RepID=A0A941GUF8_9CHRO|nr:DUF2079 domain-containing protein [Gomphosphaeria aponina SAG 52.96 = DSM 107014]
MMWKLPKDVLLSALTFFLFSLIIALHRHYTFYSTYDQGIFNQIFWNNIHGNFFNSSLASAISTTVTHFEEPPRVYDSHLGQHFTASMLLWLPLYYLFPAQATLIILQVTLVTVAGLVLYALARHHLAAPLATIITISFYSANAVIGPTLSNFHNISELPLLIFALLLAMEKRCWWLFSLFALWILAVREDAGLTLFSIGFYLILSRRYPRLGLLVCTLSFVYILLVTNVVMPLFSEDISKRFMIDKFGQYVEGEDASSLEIIWGMISQPGVVLQQLVSPPGLTIQYLLAHWLPLAFIPAISPVSWLAAGFPLLTFLLGKGTSVLVISIRYAMSVVPGLFYGTIIWWRGQGFRNFNTQLEELTPRKLTPSFRRFWIFCISLSLCFALTDARNQIFYFLIPDSFSPWVYVSLPTQWQRTKEINLLLAQIPPDASVSATTYIIPHLSGRREIIRLPALELRNDQEQVIKVEYAIADLWQLNKYQVAFKHEREMLKEITITIDNMTANNEYGIIGFKNGVILLQKGAVNHRSAAAAWLAFRQQIVTISQ